MPAWWSPTCKNWCPPDDHQPVRTAVLLDDHQWVKIAAPSEDHQSDRVFVLSDDHQFVGTVAQADDH